MEKENLPNSSEELIQQRGIISNQLLKDGITNESLGNDHLGIEILSVNPEKLYETIFTLKKYGQLAYSKRRCGIWGNSVNSSIESKRKLKLQIEETHFKRAPATAILFAIAVAFNTSC